MTSGLPGSKKVRASGLVLLALAGLGAGFVLGEIGLRSFGAGAMGRMIARRSVTPLPNRVTHQYHVTDYGYALNCEGSEGCNSFGKPAWEYRPEKADGVYRILVLGDSITEQVPTAWEDPAHLVWVQYLEKALSVRGRYEVLNSAKGGFNLPNYLGYLRARGLETKPDLILAAFCINDVERLSFVEMDGKITMIPGDPGVPFFAALFGASKLFQYAVLSSIGASPDFKLMSPDRVRASLGEMKTLAGGRIAAVVFPPFTEEAAQAPSDRRRYELIVEGLSAAGIDYFEVGPRFRGCGARVRGFRRDENDPIHFNREAHELSARAILPWLTRMIQKFPAGARGRPEGGRP